MATTEQLLGEIRDLLRTRGGGGGSSSFDGQKLPATADAAKKLTDAFKVTKSAVEDFAKKAQDSLNIWRDLSSSGSGFSNDIIGMTVAAAQSRVSLEDFAGIVKDNGKYMSGLGGSVTRGTEAFAKLSKGFFDNNMDRELRQLGYTSKDLNEILAFQASVRKSSFRDDEQSKEAVKQSAERMAREMDLTAKLTGRSREEQMDAMKKARLDMQAENKLRLLTAGMEPIKAQKVRDDYFEGLRKAQEQGAEQAYKEYYATGTYITEMGQNQAAILGRQIRVMEEGIRASQIGDTATAEAKRREASAEAMKNADNRVIQSLGAIGSAGGSASEAVNNFTGATNTAYHAVKATAAEQKTVLKSTEDFASALNEVIKEIKKSNEGIKKGQTEVMSGATQGLIELERAGQNLKSGVAAAAEAINKDGESVAKAFRDIGLIARDTINRVEGGRTGGNVSKIIEEQANRGQQPVKYDTTGLTPEQRASFDRQASGGAIGTTVSLASDSINGIGKAIAEALRAAPSLAPAAIPRQIEPQPRSGGTYGAGKIAEDVGAILKITKPGEVVLNAEQQKNLAKGIMDKGSEQAILGFKQIFSQQTEKPDVNAMSEEFKKIFSTVKTMSSQSTVKVEVSGGDEITNKRVQTDDSKAAEKEHDKVSKEFSNLKNELRAKIKEQLGPGAKPSDVRKTLTSSDEFKNLESTYKTQLDSLMKRIEDGISYETEVKKQAVSEVEKTVKQELSIVQTTREKITKTVTDATDEEILAARKLTDEQIKIRDAERAEILKAAEAKVTAEKLGYDIVSETSKKTVDEVKSAQQQIQSDIKDALPVKQVAENRRQIEEKNKLVSELEEKGKNQELSIKRKSVFESIKDKFTALQENIKFKVQEISNYKLAEEQKQKMAENTATIIEEQSKKISTNIKEELSSVGTTQFDLANMGPQGENTTSDIPISADDLVNMEIQDISKEMKKDLDQVKKQVDSGIIKLIPNESEERSKKRQEDAKELQSLAIKDGKINLDAIKLPGMPDFGFKPGEKVPKTSEAQPKADENQSAAETARLNRQANKPQQGQQETSNNPKPESKDKQATLDDVVKSLDRLNIKMGELVTKHETLMNKQISATAQNSSNVYDRMR